MPRVGQAAPRRVGRRRHRARGVRGGRSGYGEAGARTAPGRAARAGLREGALQGESRASSKGCCRATSNVKLGRSSRVNVRRILRRAGRGAALIVAIVLLYLGAVWATTP